MSKLKTISFFEEFGYPTERRSSKRMNARTLLDKCIKEQEQLLDGVDVKGKTGVSVRSWFRDGEFLPAIGNVGLFDGKGVKIDAGEEKYVLKRFGEGLEKGDFDDLIAEVEKKRQANADRLAEVRKKKK